MWLQYMGSEDRAGAHQVLFVFGTRRTYACVTWAGAGQGRVRLVPALDTAQFWGPKTWRHVIRPALNCSLFLLSPPRQVLSRLAS